jgi:hydrogenase nickel incorporation protein HypB
MTAVKIDVIQKVLKVNDELAEVVRARLLDAGVGCVNVMGGPGSGKTALIEAAAAACEGRLRIGVIEGDPDTSLDAERVARCGLPVVQINTGGGCHLEANLVLRAMDRLPLDSLDVIVIENVGNLVCPVDFDLGEGRRVAVLSTPEGHDKPAKYPKLFRSVDAVVLNKTDLLPYVDFSFQTFADAVDGLKPGISVLRTSCRTGEGIPEWAAWLEEGKGNRGEVGIGLISG